MIDPDTRPALPVSKTARIILNLPEDRFDGNGRLILRSPREARELAVLYRQIDPEGAPQPSDLFGAAYINTAWDLILDVFARGNDPYEYGALAAAGKALPEGRSDGVLRDVLVSYPVQEIWSGRDNPSEVLIGKRDLLTGREAALRSYTLVTMSLENPAFSPFRGLFTEPRLAENPEVSLMWNAVESADGGRAPREPEDTSPLATLKKPVESAPNSVKDQLAYILSRWGRLLGNWSAGLIGALDMIEEENRPRFGGPGPAQRPGLFDLDETASFSRDDAWMPRVVLLAKNVLVWLNQLSRKYNRSIHTLDAVPDEELVSLSSRGFNALWLIGLWERSNASREIKRRMGNPEAAASAYSLFGYDIAGELGGWNALQNLRHRAGSYGIRLSSDMVPNHVGLDSDWVRHHPQWLMSSGVCPYPLYSFNSDNLSEDDRVDIRLEDHYWNRSDAAVVFRRTDRGSGETRFIYHGNDGTTMPWNDTAQIDFLNADAREAVIQDILHVARNFSIIRFDAAMVLARKHIRRLWYPAPGSGGSIPSRSEQALNDEEFFKALPGEFWREVVDRVAAEVPGTLLLAEAFWMMEGYFVRVLGMHRVYNSAFMNMLRDGKNNEYRDIIRETLAFDPGILQRFVNFMNNPDEETAVEQFGKDDRYFAVCTLLATLPGLPMFGHGQIEGLREKYGMEYVRAYRDEEPDYDLIARHEREIFPLLARRTLFAGAMAFRMFDLTTASGSFENVYAFTNSDGTGRALVVVNNAYERASGRIHRAMPVNSGNGQMRNDDLAAALELDNVSRGDWCLMREHIAGLWFIRSVGLIMDSGLELMIDGYGRQVYMEFRIEQETADGLWTRLAAELNGRGIADPWKALAEIRLRPVHRALDSIADGGLIKVLAESIRRGRRTSWPAGIRDFTDKFLVLADEHNRLFGDAPVELKTREIFRRLELRLRGSAVQWNFFGRGLRRRMQRLFRKPNWDEALLLSVWSVLVTLAAAVPGRPVPELRTLWGLDKWLGDRFPEPFERRVVELAGMLLSAEGWDAAGMLYGDILPGLMARTEVRNICGVNSWDGVLWYDRDGWDDCVMALALSSAAENGGGSSGFVRRRGIKALLRKWRRADNAADYHLDRLLSRTR